MMRAAALLAACLWAGAACAQTPVYRCGPDGRSYSQEPCPGGHAIDVADNRSAQQTAQSRQAVQRDAREARDLERARLLAERQAAQQGPALIGWSKAGAGDDARCARVTKACRTGEAPKRRHDKPHTVTLYRGAGNSSR
jgi:hypothetical protein